MKSPLFFKRIPSFVVFKKVGIYANFSIKVSLIIKEIKKYKFKIFFKIKKFINV
jgi:hypothetical protein